MQQGKELSLILISLEDATQPTARWKPAKLSTVRATSFGCPLAIPEVESQWQDPVLPKNCISYKWSSDPWIRHTNLQGTEKGPFKTLEYSPRWRPSTRYQVSPNHWFSLLLSWLLRAVLKPFQRRPGCHRGSSSGCQEVWRRRIKSQCRDLINYLCQKFISILNTLFFQNAERNINCII